MSVVVVLKVKLSIAEGGACEETKVHIVYLGEPEHNDPELVTASHLDMLESLLGSKKDASESMVHSYRHAFSGFAVHLTDSQAEKIAEHPDVLEVMPNHLYELQTTRTFDYLGVSQSNPKGLLHDAKMGEDTIIGVLDSGVWPESESFSDRGLGPIPAKWKGKCVDGQEFDSKKHCNKKLIGARYYMGSLFPKNRKDSKISKMEYMSVRESLPHGTHVASIAGGAFVPNVSNHGLGGGMVRGGAPKARIAMYKVCWRSLDDSCASAEVLKAMDDAVADGVDVISISIGRPIPILTEINQNNMFSYGAFHAVSKGIPVICAGGNYGPGDFTVQNIAPWIITVAATSLDRWFPTPLTLGNNVTLMGRVPFKGLEFQADLMYIKNIDMVTSAIDGKVTLVFLQKDEDPSGRGPNSVTPYVLKPDIAAPGMGILAATTPLQEGGKSGFISQTGTSMAAPAVSGLVALLRAVHPDWSPAALKSALVTTGN
ncbi:hypothetical protein AALP_AA8G118000 [Arabis alpina]|uniref:Inhibitor I9 domain-containing protein n=1 Tax=Arabis alpina TaxID=50452 RepID=A0A087G6G0_ARAAL|nr:hypothetical protein AALP_AA8G118000 [Arabis alpina]